MSTSGGPARIDELLRLAVEARQVPGVVTAVGNRSGTVFSAARGWAQARARIEMAPDTYVRIASMTKIVTTVAILMLAEENKIDLDALLERYLPGYDQPGVLMYFDNASQTYSTTPAASSITIQQLLTHTSGYGYWFLDARLRMLTHGTPELFNPPFLTSEPGTRFCYSSGLDVLGQVVEPVSGRRLDRFFDERIFGPLGMRHTSYEKPVDTSKLSSVFARTAGGFGEEPLEATGHSPHGGGGLYSTANDYLALIRMLLNRGVHDGKRILSAESVERMTSNQIGELFAAPPMTALPQRSNDFIFMDGTQKFGYGVTIETRDQPTGRHTGSYGWGGILNTYFWVDPSADVAAVIMMQVKPFADPICVDLYRRFERSVYNDLA